MKSIALATVTALLLFSGTACVAQAEDKASEATQQEATGDVLAMDSLKAFQEDTANVDALMEFANENFRALIQEMSQSPDVAEKHIEGLRKAISGVEAKDNVQAEGLLSSIDSTLEMFDARLVAQRLTLEEVKSQVAESPSDVDSIKMYTTKLGMTFSQELGDDVDKMEKFLTTEADFVVKNEKKTEESDAKLAYKQAASLLKSLGNNVARLKAYQELVGKDMYPIDADGWANGEGFTMEELKGKVVLLDFWAIWCGPCVASFPHLVDWQEKYGDDGFQIVGLTRYYDFTWPEDAEGPQRGEGEVSPEEERKVLDKFTAQHDLKHPTAVIADPKELYEYYAVTGIPHFVLIGRDGKIRKVNAGISESRAKEFDAEIQKLLAEKAPE